MDRIAEIAARHARSVTTAHLEAFIDQLAARAPKRGTADDIRLETFCLELRNRAVRS